MIESLTGMTYGRVSTEVVYKDGTAVTNKRTTVTVARVPDRKTLLDTIFDQLQRLQTEDSVNFKIIANRHTREAERIELTTESYLD